MLDPSMTNYIGALVNQLIKKPDNVLERLAPQPPLNLPAIRMSENIFYNQQPLPLPILTDAKKTEMRNEIDKALERLANWDKPKKVCSVPQLNLRDIKLKHDKIRSSVESSPEVFTTAREDQTSEEGITVATSNDGKETENENEMKEMNCNEGRWNVAEGKEKRRTWNIPACQYSASPMLSKAYKPPMVDIPPISAPLAQPAVSTKPATEEKPVECIESSPMLAESDRGIVLPNSVTKGGAVLPEPEPKGGVVVPEPSPEGDLVLAEAEGLVVLPEPSLGGNLVLPEPEGHVVLPEPEGDVILPEPEEGVVLLHATSHDESAEVSETFTSTSSVEDTSSAILTDRSAEAPHQKSSLNLSSRLLDSKGQSPPSSQVLRHLEALEAAIELDLTMTSTPGCANDNTSRSATGSAVKRRLELNSPPDSPSDRRSSLSLNLSGVQKAGNFPPPSPTGSDASRRSISFYVEVESPRSPRSPAGGLLRRNTISSPRASPRAVNRIPSNYERSRSSSALTTPTTPLETGVSGNAVETVPSSDNRRIRHESYSTPSSQVLEDKANKITALVRGYLTRTLMKSYKVQTHLKTIRDTKEILREAEEVEMSDADRAFINRLTVTLQQTKDKVYAIFLETSLTEQMSLIAHTRTARRELLVKELQGKLVKPGSARKKIVKKSKQKRSKAWI